MVSACDCEEIQSELVSRKGQYNWLVVDLKVPVVNKEA